MMLYYSPNGSDWEERMPHKVGLGLCALLFLASGGELAAQGITHHLPLPPPALTQPPQGTAYHDPVFGLPIRRLTDSRQSGQSGVVPDYSKRQLWNCDESLLLLRTIGGDTLLYDAKDYHLIKSLDAVGGEDVFWHPTQPLLLYFNTGNSLDLINVQTMQVTRITTFSEYSFANTRGEGNLSQDGRFYALVGQLYDVPTGEMTFKDLLLFDIEQGAVVGRLPLPAPLEDFDWVSISPKGNFIVVDYGGYKTGRYGGLEVYDRSFNFLWQKPVGYGHSDLGLDPNGDEILVIGLYDADTNESILMKYRLADGTQTELLRHSPMVDHHISCRNLLRPGWAFISTYATAERVDQGGASPWLPFEDEIFAVKLDGSRDVLRYAHHRSRRYPPHVEEPDPGLYFAEPHATVSPRGDKIIYGSNWGDTSALDRIDAYLVDLNPAVRQPNGRRDRRPRPR